LSDLLYVIDVSSLVFQVFHAIPEMTSPHGLPTNAVFGFARDILNIIKQRQPTHLICATDPEGPGERERLYPAYKAHRSATPEELGPQFPLIDELIEGFGIPAIEQPGWEADDVIATIVEQARSRDMDVCIVSGDKDVRQLLGPRVRIYQVRKDQFFDQSALKADWGIRPEQVIDFQALVGDSVDNVPGVPLVGPKKAGVLLNKFETLDEVLAHADEAPGAKLRENLKTHAEQARQSRVLVTLRRDLPIVVDWNQARVGQYNEPRLQEFFRRMGFKRFGEELRELCAKQQGTTSAATANQEASPGGMAPSLDAPLPAKGADKARQRALAFDADDGPPHAIPPRADSQGGPTNRSGSTTLAPGKRPLAFEIVDTPEKLASLVARLAEKLQFCLDLETTALDPMRADIVGYAISWDPCAGHYIPVRGPAGQNVLAPEAVCEALRPVLEHPRVEITNQNIKYDMLVLRRAGIRLRGVGFDPMIGSYLLEAGARTHNLEDLSRRYLQHEMIPISDLIGKGLFQKRMDEIDVPRVAEYAVEDAEVAWELAQRLGADLRAQGLWDLYWTLERPLIEILAEMQYNGIRVDVGLLAEQSALAQQKLWALRSEIFQLAGREFNIDSPKQLQQVLFDELGLPRLKKTKTGSSTDQEVLEQLAPKHPLPAKILEHRGLTKLKGTYLDALPALVNPETGRIHTSFNQVVASTGRLSSSEPNLQNIPIRTEEGRRVRQAFIPRSEGWQLLCADYSQIELRVLAHFSGDLVLQEAFRKGEDIHTAVAAEVFGVAPEAVDSHMRRMAKAVNFGVIYGQSPYGLAANLGIDAAEATAFINNYFARYSGVDAYLDSLLRECRRTGYARTILGRRRAIEGLRDVPHPQRQRNLSERTAINTVIQGSAADLIKQAMINVYRRLCDEGRPARMLLQIHDELVFEVPADQTADIGRLVREEMEGAMSLSVPVKVDLSAGPNWLDVETIAEQ
jgi:DNA polymerase I